MRCHFCRILAGEADGVTRIHAFAHGWALVNADQTHKGACLMVLSTHHEDTLDIPDPLYRAFNDELRLLGRAVRAAFGPARLNYLNLGNVEPHVHVHILPRYPDDPHWGGPPATPRGDRSSPAAEQAAVAAAIRAHLPPA